jgi:hypothetical protein
MAKPMRPCLFWLVAAAWIGLAALMAEAAGPLLPQVPPPTVLVPHIVVGEVVRMETKEWVIKDENGKEMELQISPNDTQVDRGIEVGDKITAEVFQDGRARSIVKTPR